MRTLILAGSFSEAAAYARAAGLRHYRFAASAGQVGGFMAQRVVELPGFSRRADQHSLNAVAKRAERRGAERVKDTIEAHLPEPTPPTPTEKLAAFTREDWLFGRLPDVQAAEILREAGATDEEIEALTPGLTEEQVAAVEAANQPKAPEPKPAAKPKRTRKTPAPKRSGNAAVPVAAESNYIPTEESISAGRDLDDLFED